MSLKSLVNQAVSPVIRALPTGVPPVFLLGHDRSGSTWLGRTLGLCHHSIYLHEPLNEHASRLGNWELYNVHQPKHAVHSGFEAVFDRAARGEGVRDLSKREIADRLFRHPTVIIKETGGMMNGEWFQKRYGARILMLTRHPAPLILSNVKMGAHNAGHWFEKLLEQTAMMEEYCGDVDARALGGSHDDVIARFAVVYCVRYRVALAQMGRNPDWVHLSYERFCENPVESFRLLFERLDLEFTPRIEGVIARDCSVDGSQAFYGTKRISRDHVGKWFNQMNDADKRKIRRILDAFDFPLYRNDSDWRKTQAVLSA